MTDQGRSDRLQASIGALRTLGLVPGMAKALRESAATAVVDLQAHIVGEVAAFSASGNPDVLPELQRHLEQQVEEICGLLSGARPAPLEFITAHAQRCAAQKFPLDALLQAYQSMHKILSERLRDAAIATADDSAHIRRVVAAVTEFSVEYIGTISTLLTSEYVSQTRLLAEAEGDRRTELLNMLLRGYDESDTRAAQLLKRAGYLEQRQSFCIVVARSVDPREMENPARAQRMLESVDQVVRNLPVRSQLTVRDNLVTAVISGTRRQSGWTAAQSLLADRVYPHLRTIGPAALIGMSSDAPSTSHIPRALSEAKLALDFASVSQRVMRYSGIPFRHMLVRLAADNIQSALPIWVESFLGADRKARGKLLETLRAYANADMNVLKTAKALSIHPNTIYARMQRIDDTTGKNALSYKDLTELLLAMDCAGE